MQVFNLPISSHAPQTWPHPATAIRFVSAPAGGSARAGLEALSARLLGSSGQSVDVSEALRHASAKCEQ